jgi:hypothetical protein
MLKYGFIGGFPNIGGRLVEDDMQFTVAWYHMYDYKLTGAQIQEEMKYWDKPEYNGPMYDFPSYAGQGQYIY